MTPSTQNTCLEILSAMLSPSQLWNDAAASLYSIAMHGWSDDIAMRTVKQIALTEKWRPAPAELHLAAAKIVVGDIAPIPTPSAIRAEVRRLLVWHGRTAGDAKHLHPVVALIADDMGGWRELSGMFTEQIDEAFPGAYQRGVEALYRDVAQTQLSVPAAERTLSIEGARRELAAR